MKITYTYKHLKTEIHMKKLLLSASLLLASYAVFAQTTPAPSGNKTDEVKVETTTKTTHHKRTSGTVKKKPAGTAAKHSVSSHKSTSTYSKTDTANGKKSHTYLSKSKKEYVKRDSAQ